VTLTHFEITMTLLLAIVSVLSVLAAGLRWIYRQGVSSQKLVTAINENTTATGKLSGAFDKFTEKTDGTLLDHEKRLTHAEDRLDATEHRLSAVEGKQS
jgi:hypothetical protein